MHDSIASEYPKSEKFNVVLFFVITRKFIKDRRNKMNQMKRIKKKEDYFEII